jgi:hypothetical protein
MMDRVWLCRDGRQLLVSQMDERHIVNCINKIQRHWPRWRAEYLPRLEIELVVRQIKRGA